VRTVVYIDGFNLYYRRLKPSPQFTWLNLKALCDSILAPPMVVQRVVLLSSAMATTSMRKQQVTKDNRRERELQIAGGMCFGLVGPRFGTML
jgi:hypothetical protein